jgi:FkbM family methyltransferase
MTPERRYPHPPTKPPGTWFTRGLNALTERRVPYTLQVPLDRTLSTLGLPHKTVTVADHKVTYRRCTTDEVFVHSILMNQEYFRAGYAPSPGDTIVDVGANIGTFTLAAKIAAPTATVIAVEPMPNNVELLRRNVTQNNLQYVTIVPVAVGARNDVVDIYFGGDTGYHSLVLDRGLGMLRVQQVTLDTLFDQNEITTCHLLKIDCEGAEFEFLPTVSPATWARIQKIAMEFTVPIQDRDWTPSNPTASQVQQKLAYGDYLIDLFERHDFCVDHYIDCVGWRAGYIFARQNT